MAEALPDPRRLPSGPAGAKARAGAGPGEPAADENHRPSDPRPPQLAASRVGCAAVTQAAVAYGSRRCARGARREVGARAARARMVAQLAVEYWCQVLLQVPAGFLVPSRGWVAGKNTNSAGTSRVVTPGISLVTLPVTHRGRYCNKGYWLLFPIQLPAKMPGKQWKMAQSTWELEKTPCFGLAQPPPLWPSGE